MQCKHIQAAANSLLALILAGFAPPSLAAPSGPEVVLEATGTGLAYLEVELRPRKGETFSYKLEGSKGLIVGGITLPAEASDYEITAFDTEGKVTFFGRGSIPSFMTDDPPLQISLPPANPEEGKNDGLIVSLSRERVVLRAKPMDEPNSFSIEARVTDPHGNAVPLDQSDVQWGLTDPTHFELQPLKERFTGVILRPREDGPFVTPAGILCDVPPHVVMCIPGRHCRAVKVCNDPWVTISAGHSHTCALTQSGAAYCWGSNDSRELGVSNTETCVGRFGPKCSTRPLRVECAAGESKSCRFTQIAAGEEFTVATDSDGNTWVWGRRATGHQLVSAANGSKPLRFEQITAGDSYGCGIAKGGEVWCWGQNGFGKAGAPLTMNSVPFDSAVQVLSPVKFSKVVAAGQHTCGTNVAGDAVVCWGRDDQNQTTGPSSTQFSYGGNHFYFQHFGGLTPVLDVAVSGDSSCAKLGNGNGLYCWGGNASLDLRPLGTPDHLAAGRGHLCTISAQTASCVGANLAGQLGIGSLMDPGMPVTPNAPPTEFASFSTGTAHTCGITPNGEAYCWGRSLEGQIGNGASNWGVLAPAQITVP